MKFDPKSIRTLSCECGYDPSGKSKITDAKCSSILPLYNHIAFPSLKMLPDDKEVKELYYDRENGSPKLHWCFFIEIEKKIKWNTWSGFTRFCEPVTLELKLENEENPVTFELSDVKRGHTIAILYAEKNESSIIEDCLDYCYVFKESIKVLYEEAAKLLVNSDLVSKQLSPACFGCANEYKLSRCTVCLLAKYCSLQCQRECWKNGHQKLCRQSDTLLKLAALPRHPFKKHLDFTVNGEDSLPPYTYMNGFDFWETLITQTKYKA
jgi:hypothetical protein